MQLLAAIRSLGSTVVYADFSRIIVATRKRTAREAAHHAAYVVDTIQKKELFKWITLEPRVFWGQLLFMDSENFGGIDVTSAAMLGDQGPGPESDDIGLDEPLELKMHWNLATYLTPHARTFFEVMVGNLLDHPYTYNREQLKDEQNPGVNLTVAQQDERTAIFLNELIRTKFTPSMMEYTSQVQQKDTPQDFPVNAGSYLDVRTPALEFVKAVCQVMHLDVALQSSVDILKVQLLRLLAVRDFSPESQWHNPSLDFVLHDVICDYCNNCEDLDLCRDPELTDGEVPLQDRWKCKLCLNP